MARVPSERIQRRIEAFLDEADAAASAGEWRAVAEKARAVLAIDEANEDAAAFLKMATANLAGTGTARPLDPTGNRFDRFTDHVRRALNRAQEEALRLHHSHIGTEHVLLGLVHEEDSTAVAILAGLGVEPRKVRAAVEFTVRRGNAQLDGEIGLTRGAKRMLELTVDEARSLGHDYIGTGHLLAGLVLEGEGVAAGVLESLGASAERVRAEAERIAASEPREE